MFQLMVVRHAQTQLNKDGILQGQLDEPLNNTGRKQAEALSQSIAEEKFTHVFSSDLKRTKDTCQIALSKNTLYQNGHLKPTMMLDPMLRERSYGCMEGVDSKVFTPPGAESPIALQRRAETFFLKLCKKMQTVHGNNLTKSINVLVVTHGAFLRAFYKMFEEKLGCIFSNDIEVRMSNAGRTTFKIFLPPIKKNGMLQTTIDDQEEKCLKNITVKCTGFDIPTFN